MILFKILILIVLTLPSYGKTPKQELAHTVKQKKSQSKTISKDSKEEYVKFLKTSCELSQKDKVLWKKTKICNCFEQKMSELSKKELQHLVLDTLGKGHASELSIEDSQFIENYKLEVAYKCMGKEPPPGKKTKD